MDAQSAHHYLSGIYEGYRTHFEGAQERFPKSLIRLSKKDAFAGLAGLREFAGIKGDILRAHETITHEDAGDAIHTINTASHNPDIHDTYAYEMMRTRHLLHTAIPRELLIERENLRQRGYIILDHAQDARRHDRTSFGQRLVKAAITDGKVYSDSYLSHVEKVFENARRISEIQAHKLELESPYDANLTDFTPGVYATDYQSLIEALFENAVTARNAALLNQEKQSAPHPLPDFSFEQGQKLVNLLCALIPLKEDGEETYTSHMLDSLPSLCMGKLATIRYSPNPLTLIETTFHERLGHLTYRENAERAGGINGFHLDEARALSLERFLLRERDVWEHIASLLSEAYGKDHPAFDPDNLYRHTHWVHADLEERTCADDLTYIIQETIRARAELYVMNGHFDATDIPDFMASETELAFGLSDLNGYHLMRETFQWPLAMQGHLAAYPTGLLIAAGLHAAAKQSCGTSYTNISKGAESPYFRFMEMQIDVNGTTKSPKSLIETATEDTFLDMTPIQTYLDAKANPIESKKPKTALATPQVEH